MMCGSHSLIALVGQRYSISRVDVQTLYSTRDRFNCKSEPPRGHEYYQYTDNVQR